MENIKGASYNKTFTTAPGGEGKTIQPAFARRKCTPSAYGTSPGGGGSSGSILCDAYEGNASLRFVVPPQAVAQQTLKSQISFLLCSFIKSAIFINEAIFIYKNDNFYK